MKNIIIKSVLTIFTLIVLTSCDKKQGSVALSQPASIGIQDSDSPLVLSVLSPKSQIVDIRVEAKSKSDKNMTVSVKVDRDLVEKYNKENGTSYSIVPPDAYSFDKTDAILPRYNEVSSTIKLSLSSEAMPDAEQYLLPVAIDYIDGDPRATIDETSSVRYVIFNKRELQPAISLDRTDWSIVYCNSVMIGTENASGDPESGPVECLIDGNDGTYWNYRYNKPSVLVPNYVIIDMAKEVTVRGAILKARRYAPTTDPSSAVRHTPCDMDIFLANELIGTEMDAVNNTNWIYTEHFGQDVIKYQFENTVYLSEIHRARYLMIKVNMSWRLVGGNPSPDYKAGSFAEWETLGNYEVLDLD